MTTENLSEVSASSLPCLFSSNSTETLQDGPVDRPSVPSHYRKAAVALAWNVAALADQYGLEHLGFLTLTFRDHVLDVKEASKRFNSLASHVLNDRYVAWLRVLERQKSGRIHYHLVVVLRSDIRSGVDFAAIASGDYRSAGPALREEWAFWRRTAPLYRFGRTELLPVVSSAEAISRYVGKYLGKHLDARLPADKGARLVSTSKGARMASTRFSWASTGLQWRLACRSFAWAMFCAGRVPSPSMRGLAVGLGPRWAYEWGDIIRRWPVGESLSPDG